MATASRRLPQDEMIFQALLVAHLDGMISAPIGNEQSLGVGSISERFGLPSHARSQDTAWADTLRSRGGTNEPNTPEWGRWSFGSLAPGTDVTHHISVEAKYANSR
jgi:hypothetical protein